MHDITIGADISKDHIDLHRLPDSEGTSPLRQPNAHCALGPPNKAKVQPAIEGERNIAVWRA